MEQGMFHIYTGNGKGKTTAMLGLSVRAACSGMRVYIGQFMKGQDYSELCLPERFSEITMEQYGTPQLLGPGEKPSPRDLELAREGLNRIREALHSGRYHLVAADEICVTVHLGLLDEQPVLDLIDSRPTDVELVFTGRYASNAMTARADLVTEMKEIRHYFATSNTGARRGIEN